MERIIQEILQSELGEDIQSIQEIGGLGSVNKVFDIKGTYNNYNMKRGLEKHWEKYIKY
jgi:hypothetical protein